MKIRSNTSRHQIDQVPLFFFKVLNPFQSIENKADLGKREIIEKLLSCCYPSSYGHDWSCMYKHLRNLNVNVLLVASLPVAI